MVHLRIVVPSERADAILALLESCKSVINIVHLEGVARKPDGDVVLCDVAREDASVVIADLRHLEVPEYGSISIDDIDSSLSRAADDAEAHAAGSPADAVIWEQVSATTSESATLSGGYLVFIVLASLIAGVGILLDSPILIVGAMVVGPEFGPVAGVCVALVERRPHLAAQSLLALGVGFPLGILMTVLSVLLFKATGVVPDGFDTGSHAFSGAIAKPDFLSFFVAFCAGIAGMISLSTAKSGALIGVLISVTTIPAAANAAVAMAYGDWGTVGGSAGQLAVNLSSMLVAGTLTLTVQRAQYARRRREHRARTQKAVV
jgi:uncharacterized hydrophobic protein (TIGR00271 family)